CVLAALVSLAGSPAWVLAFCPTLHRLSAAHSCCPMHKSTPAPQCVTHCAAASAPLLKASAIVIVAPAVGVALDAPAPIARIVSPDPIHDVSGDLWLRD